MYSVACFGEIYSFRRHSTEVPVFYGIVSYKCRCSGEDKNFSSIVRICSGNMFVGFVLMELPAAMVG